MTKEPMDSKDIFEELPLIVEGDTVPSEVEGEIEGGRGDDDE